LDYHENKFSKDMKLKNKIDVVKIMTNAYDFHNVTPLLTNPNLQIYQVEEITLSNLPT